MQSLAAADPEDPANAGNTRLLSPPVDEPLTKRQMAELREAWLKHQINPPGEIESRGREGARDKLSKDTMGRLNQTKANLPELVENKHQ